MNDVAVQRDIVMEGSGETNTSLCFGYFGVMLIWNVVCIQSSLAVMSWIVSFFPPSLINLDQYKVIGLLLNAITKRIFAFSEIQFHNAGWPLEMNLSWPANKNFWLSVQLLDVSILIV